MIHHASKRIFVMLAGLGALPLEAMPAPIDYDRSSIEIVGKAAGFIPAVFDFPEFEAQIDLSEQRTELRNAVLSFNYNNITSGSLLKDNRIREWLEAESHPEGRFTLARIEKEGEDAVAVGRLRLHGQTDEARFTYKIDRQGSDVILDATAIINYRKWDLPTLRIFFFKIREELEIRIHIVSREG